MGISDGFARVDADPWLVLGGGGVKGIAHVGALRALAEAGVRPAGIVGTSIGALVGALAASGVDTEEGHRIARSLEHDDIVRVNRRAVWINGIRQVSVFRGDTLLDYLRRVLPPEGWDAMDVPLLINAVDLGDGSTEWFGPDARTDLPLAEAVYASCALPGFYPPWRADGRAYVDGGTAHPLPIHRAADEGAGRVIAIDVGSGREGDVEETLAQGFLGIHQRVFSIMTYRRRQDALARWDGPPLLHVRPRLDGYGPFGFEHIEYFLGEGYRATREALEGVGLGVR